MNVKDSDTSLLQKQLNIDAYQALLDILFHNTHSLSSEEEALLARLFSDSEEQEENIFRILQNIQNSRSAFLDILSNTPPEHLRAKLLKGFYKNS